MREQRDTRERVFKVQTNCGVQSILTNNRLSKYWCCPLLIMRLS